jgi:hypothetical protein
MPQAWLVCSAPSKSAFAIVMPPRVGYTKPGHEIPRTEYQTKFIKNRTKFTETKKFGFLFSSEFPETKFTEVNTETEPNLPNLLNLPNLSEM